MRVLLLLLLGRGRGGGGGGGGGGGEEEEEEEGRCRGGEEEEEEEGGRCRRGEEEKEEEGGGMTGAFVMWAAAACADGWVGGWIARRLSVKEERGKARGLCVCCGGERRVNAVEGA